MNRCPLILYILFILFINSGIAKSNNESVYFRNFVRHSTGEFCRHTSPTTTFMAFLNGNQSKVLFDNAPRWDEGGDPNIDGKGTFGVELGNFTEPDIEAGDSVFVRFTCNATREQGVLADYVSSIPFVRFPLTLDLSPIDLPTPPQNVTLTIDESNRRVISWTQESDVTYSVYRRNVEDTVKAGLSRMLYTRIAENLNVGIYVDTTTSTEAHGYVVVPGYGEVFGSHSREVVDFPLPPQGVTAAVAYTNPFKVAITWQSPNEQMSLHYRVYQSVSPGIAINQTNFTGKTAEIFWLDSLVTEGETYYYRVVAVNSVGIQSQPSEEVSVTVQIFANGLPDLDILHISRSPKYPRYEIVYDPPGYNPRLKPGTENDPHYPATGELMRYTAVVRNSGGGTVEGFNLYWWVDSVLVQTETYGRLYPRQRISSVLQWPWDSQPSYIKCEVQPIEAPSEVTTANNTLRIQTNALSFHFHAERNILDLFESHKNPMGSYSFEDWAQVHVNQMNKFFANARYPHVTPSGVPEAVFLDTVSYYDNGQLSGIGTHAPHSLLWDGQWGFTGDTDAINYFRNIVLNQNKGMDWALLHELGHQIGLIDLYRIDVSQRQLKVIEPRTGKTPPLTPIAWDVLYYCSRKDYLMHTNFEAGFSDHSAGALLRNLSRRRGYYGDYLADIPYENALLIQRSDGSPVRNAEVLVYQKQDDVIPNIPKFRGKTNSSGIFLFPHITDSLYNGGIRVKNPFSTIYSPDPHVVGTNSTLFVRVVKGDSVGYQFIDVCDFNVAYWSGDSLFATYPLTFSEWYFMPASNVRKKKDPWPDKYALFQSYPNPFNLRSRIRYQLPTPSKVKLMIYNISGQKVRTLADGNKDPGIYTVTWDGTNDAGSQVASGIYFYHLKAGKFSQVRKIILLK
ncbi:MAG: FlgD immunoglobulin-like domain containing protein [Fidelibacterota bacterium]